MRFLAAILLALMAATPRLPAAEPAVRDDVRRLFRQLDGDGDGQLTDREVGGQHARLYTRLLRTSDLDGDGRLVLDEFDHSLTPHRPAKPLPEKQSSRLPGADELLLLIAMMDANADGVIRLDEVPERLKPFFWRVEERIGRTEDREIRARAIAQAAPRLSQVASSTVRRLGLDVELEISLLPEKSWAMVQRLDRPPVPGERLADPQEAELAFGALDANDDGMIVYEEVPEPFQARFDRLLGRADRNGDGRISAEEFRRLSRRLQARRGGDTMSGPEPRDAP